ncbi:MAG: hypothetical protein MI975_13685 [Cytophagales bacterium]|nr:hypothetical protein [Cytophagales bacterium]
MSFGQHIYIVKSEEEEQDQITHDWISSFHRFLELLLKRLSGEQVSINVINHKELDVESMYSPFMLLIPVVSQELLNSPTFKEDLKVFHEKAINKSKNNISWNSRIFKIVREPQKGHFLLDYLSNSVSYDFFHFDTSTDELVVYDDFTGPTSEKTFWMRLYDLAYDIFKVMDGLKSIENEIAQISTEINTIAIYLAEVGADLISKRDSIKRELIRNGYKVLPEKNMPIDLESIMKQVKKDLATCNMSVHLVGSDYGKIQGSNVSIIDLQNRMAAEHFNELEKLDSDSELNLGRVIWVAPELTNISVKQRLFIENLKKDSDSMLRADLLETTIEELKTFVINKIHEELNKRRQLTGSGDKERNKIIYLIYDKSEAHKCKKIENYLLSNGYEVISSNFSGNPDEIRTKHNEYLRKCDAALIYYGNENEEWMKSKQKDLLKSLGLGRKKPINPQAILIENESQLDESLGLNEKAMILQSHKRFSPKVIEPFLARLEE